MTIHIPVDEKWLSAAGVSPSEAENEFRVILATRLFETGRLTLSQSAEMAGMDLWRFADHLRSQGISITNLSEDELLDDLRTA